MSQHPPKSCKSADPHRYHHVQRNPGRLRATGSSLQASATRMRKQRLRPGTLPLGRHRPYEGQQLGDRGGFGPPAVPVVIAPTRGSNDMTAASPTGVSRGRHRPYEGQQQRDGVQAAGADQGCHRPYEGPATRSPRHATTGSAPVVMAPTRGSNMLIRLVEWAALKSSWPLRGAATTWWRRGRAALSGSSSPLRGAATWPSRRWTAGSPPVVIAPTRGSNATNAPGTSPSTGSRHRPPTTRP